MFKILCLFASFLFSRPGKGRLATWRALRAVCLKRAQVGLTKADES